MKKKCLLFLIFTLINCQVYSSEEIYNEIECPISPYIYIEFREWLIGLDIQDWKTDEFENVWQKYSSYIDTSGINESSKIRFEIIDRHRISELSVYEVSEYSIESCQLNFERAISRYFYKIKNRAYLDETRVIVAYHRTGVINYISIEDKETAIKMDKGRTYTELK